MSFQDYPHYIAHGESYNENVVELKVYVDSSFTINDEDLAESLKAFVDSVTGLSNATVNKKTITSTSV